MCGIAGVINLSGERQVPAGSVSAMAAALFHRGPDEEGFLVRPGFELASRRLSIVGLADGQQPLSNEDRSVQIVYNGELFDHIERRGELEGRGHRFSTHCDGEVIPHLWEDHDVAMLERLRGQFAFALWDQRQARIIIARDRFGVCPVFWAQQDDWLVFASEIKAILASGLVKARPDPRGLNHVFTFFGMPGPITCFKGIEALLPGRYLDIRLPRAGAGGAVQQRTYWEMDFPDYGHEDRGRNPKQLVDQFEHILLGAVERRLRADVPVVSYLSGGVDSSTVAAMACHIRGEPIPTFTIRITDPALDETNESRLVARHIGARPVEVPVGPQEVIDTYPKLIAAAESPVVDTSCAAMLLLARQVRASGYKVALTGEGADEWLAGYPWFKLHKALGWLDVVPGLNVSQAVRRAFLKFSGVPQFSPATVKRTQQILGGPNPWLDFYGLMSLSKLRFFSDTMQQVLTGPSPYEELELNQERLRRWHPFNRGLYLGGRVHLPGLLLNAKGDRVAMHSSVETRYPFLDEKVFAFLAQLHPRWKLKGMRDKHLLRVLAERWLPKQVARRPKIMFRAPLDSFHPEPAPNYVEELLSDESLRRTDYFNVEAVRHWRKAYATLRAGSSPRVSVELGLAGVVATQLWHHTFIDGSLSALPSMAGDRLRTGTKRAPHGLRVVPVGD